MDEQSYINIHAHRLSKEPGEWVLSNLMAADIQATDLSKGNYSVGLHPYRADSPNADELLRQVDDAALHDGVLAIGETGLDKGIDIDMDLQLKILCRQAEIALDSGLPLILHVVRAHQEILAFKKTYGIRTPMIIHGFRGNVRVAEMLLNAGFYLSFGWALLQENPGLKEACRIVPAQRLYLESDASEIAIRDIYTRAAECRNDEIHKLRLQIQENTLRDFKKFRNGR